MILAYWFYKLLSLLVQEHIVQEVFYFMRYSIDDCCFQEFGSYSETLRFFSCQHYFDSCRLLLRLSASKFHLRVVFRFHKKRGRAITFYLFQIPGTSCSWARYHKWI